MFSSRRLSSHDSTLNSRWLLAYFHFMKCTFYRLIQLKYSNLLWMISITVSFFSEYQQIILCISNKELLCFIKIHIIIIYNNYYSAGNSPYTKTKAHSTNNSPFIKSGRNKQKTRMGRQNSKTIKLLHDVVFVTFDLPCFCQDSILLKAKKYNFPCIFFILLLITMPHFVLYYLYLSIISRFIY